MATTGNERYLRYILLLGKGSLLVLRRIIAKEVAKRGQTLEQILSNNRPVFKRLFREQRLKLYPSAAAVNADTETWDISLLYQVLTKLFKSNLTPQERLSVSILKTARDEIQGHPDEMCMNENDFQVNFDDMEQNLTQLACGLGAETAGEIHAVIESSKSESIDVLSAINNVKELNEFKTEVIHEIERNFNIVHSQLSDINNQLKGIGDSASQQKDLLEENRDKLNNISTIQSHLHEDVLDAKSTGNDTNRTVHGLENKFDEILTRMGITTNTEANRKNVSQLLFDHVQAIQRDGSAIKTEELKPRIDKIFQIDPNCNYQLLEALLKFLDDVNSNPEAHVGQVSLGSICMVIRCSSMGGLLRHMEYMETKVCQQRLEDISTAVRSVLDISCSITWMIVPDSLLAFLKCRLAQHKSEESGGKEKKIVLPVHYTSLKGLTHVWRMFQEGAVDNHMKHISGILTECVGEDVRVSISYDSDQFMKAVYEARPKAFGGYAPLGLDYPEVPTILTYKNMFEIDDTTAVDKNETLMMVIHTAVIAYFALEIIAKCYEVVILMTLTNLAIIAMQNWMLLLQRLLHIKERYCDPPLAETEEEDATYETASSDSETEDDDESD